MAGVGLVNVHHFGIPFLVSGEMGYEVRIKMLNLGFKLRIFMGLRCLVGLEFDND